MNNNFVLREKCPACGSHYHKTIYQASYDDSHIREYLFSSYSFETDDEIKYVKGANYILEECDSCKLIFQKEIPNESLMYKIYEQWINPHNAFERHKNEHLEYFIHQAKHIINLIHYFGNPPCKLKFLDFGMGWGHWCRLAQAFGCEVYGIELSKVRIDYVKTFGINVLQWEEIPNRQFHFINTEQVFEHLAEPLETLRYLKDSLMAGGLLRLSVPDGSDIKRRLKTGDWKAPKGTKNSLNPVAPLEHINCFNHDALVSMAENVGLKLASLPENCTILLEGYVKYNMTFLNVAKALIKSWCHRFLVRKGTHLHFSK